MTDCIIFDFDGTIADTSAGIIATTQEAFRQLGFPEISEEQIRPTIGLVLEQSLQRAAGLTAEQTVMAARKYREIFPELRGFCEHPFPGSSRNTRGIQLKRLQDGDCDLPRTRFP